ncbi:carbamoyltransferase N-terminal domain-containing protein [Micrococcus sp.]|uniref:carbamoyltransferase N-terminal domain-containing protein n=1 Tax=Micrococcus sp. TaxID=1271 RepID=UPI002A9158A6|nr:carbamoyltransferase N-terminal domain-containing protein [Micrococcus sp.]MDY6055160.1 carbamoyltransferase N-terminal domain-containing protein [Micrococcus sp.]
MIVLGLNGYLNADHDASAALVVDGVVEAVVEEERLIRRKRAPGMHPVNAAAEVLSVGSVKAEDVDVIAYPWRPDLLGESADQERNRIIQDLRDSGIEVNPEVPVEFIQHHESHAWSGLAFVAPERRKECQILVLDGSGEDSSGAVFRCEGMHLVTDSIFSVQSSAGAMYEAATELAGFGWGEEGKLMGLSSYVERGTLPCSEVERLKRCIAQEEAGQRSAATDKLYADSLARWSQLVTAAAGPRRATFIGRAFVAAVAQAALEERIAELVGAFRSRTVVFAGGTALNCASNGKLAVTLQRQGRELVVPPCANDSG